VTELALWGIQQWALPLYCLGAGEELLPEEDPSQFKPLPEPSLLDSFLVTSQISTYCDQINMASTQTMEKLFVMGAFAS
jgi:translation initiation factor 3 subunit H